MDAIQRAFTSAQRSLLNCKATSADLRDAILASNPQQSIYEDQPNFAGHAEQLAHFTDWTYAATNAIAEAVQMQPVHVGIPRGKELIEFTSHPLLELFSDPNEVESFADVMYITTTILELCGRCLWWLPAQNGRRMILVVNPSWLVSVKGSRTKGLTFWVRPPKMAEPFPVPSSEACYFSYPSPLAPEGSDTVEP